MDHNHNHHVGHIEPLESPLEYAKFIGIILSILLLSAFLTWAGSFSWATAMANFMGVFFLVFGTFKLIGYEMFVIAYRGYDIIASRYKIWGYLFPFIELTLGAAYVLVGNSLWLNVFTILITSSASIGVFKELRRKSKIKCACLGTVIKLPLSKVSFVEDIGMLAMACVMVFL